MGRERVLIISHSYTPFINPRAFRWTAIAECWVRQGIKVDVITSWLPNLKRFEIINGVTIHRIGGGVIERLRTALRPKSRATTADNPLQSIISTTGFFSKLSGLMMAAAKFANDKIWKNVYWPDYACLWIGLASKKALELGALERYGTVISVSDPFSSHLVGKSVKLHYPNVNWLVDIGDPYCFRHDNPTNNHTLYKKLNYRKECQIFEIADAISVTTETTRCKYAELFAGTAGKIKVIPPMMTEIAPTSDGKRVLPENKNIKLVYVGTLYRSIRNPEYLLKLFKSFLSTPGNSNIELHFFGGYDDCREIFKPYQFLFADKFTLHGLVNRTDVFKAISEADILINIGNDNSYQLPSKLVEYAWIGKQIMNLYSIDNDTSKDFLKDYPAILNLDTRPNSSMVEQVRKLTAFIDLLPVNVSEKFLHNWRKQFGVETIANEYAKLIKCDSIIEQVPA